MNYWQRWIGDWKRKTAHLSACEKGVYGELLDYLYANDIASLPLDHRAVYRIAGASDKQEMTAVDVVLAQFFQRREDCYFSRRTAEELARRNEYVSEQRERGIKGAQARWEKPKPSKGNGAHPTPEIAIPDWLDSAVFSSWIASRPARARTPASKQAAIAKLEKFRAQGHDPNAIVQESLANGWQGIFAPSSGKGGAKTQANIGASQEWLRREEGKDGTH